MGRATDEFKVRFMKAVCELTDNDEVPDEDQANQHLVSKVKQIVPKAVDTVMDTVDAYPAGCD